MDLAIPRFHWPEWKPLDWYKIGTRLLHAAIILAILAVFTTVDRDYKGQWREYTPLSNCIWILSAASSSAYMLSLNRLRGIIPPKMQHSWKMLHAAEVCVALTFFGDLCYLTFPELTRQTLFAFLLVIVGMSGVALTRVLHENHRPKT